MTRTWIGSAVPLVAIALALVGWSANPADAWAWTLIIGISVVMLVLQYLSRLAVRRSPGHAAAIRNADAIANGVVFGGLMVIVPLALKLSQTYGIVDAPDSGRRMVIVISGAYLAVTGNAMPRMLPPTSAMQGYGGRIQAFQRSTAWTCVLCGLGFVMAGLTLPMDAAVRVSVTLAITNLTVAVVQILRLRKLQPDASPLA